MTDEKILDLFFERCQQGIAETREKYGDRLFRLANSLLDNRLDAEECVSDTLLAAWNAIPPNRPLPLLPWLFATARHIAVSRCRAKGAKKRGGGEFEASLEELLEIADLKGSPERAFDLKELTAVLNSFLSRLPRKDRLLLMGRYYAGESYCTLAQKLDMTEENCQVRVHRLRKKLKEKLEKEGLL